MAQFNYTVIKEDDSKFNILAEKPMGGNSSSPFKEGAEFKPNGKWEIAESEKGNCFVLIKGTVSGIDCVLWLSTLLKTGMSLGDNGKVTEIRPAGLNQQAMAANVGSMTCRKAAEWFLTTLKKEGGYKSLKVLRIPFKTIRDGKEATSSLCQFNIID